MRTTSITGLCIAFAGAGTNLSTPDARRRTFHIARVLTRTIKTLTYIGVGHHDCNESMYDIDCAWYRVTSRPADGESSGKRPHDPPQTIVHP